MKKHIKQKKRILKTLELVPYYKWEFEDDYTLVAIPDEWSGLTKQTIIFSTNQVIEFYNVQLNRKRLRYFNKYSKLLKEC